MLWDSVFVLFWGSGLVGLDEWIGIMVGQVLVHHYFIYSLKNLDVIIGGSGNINFDRHRT